MRTVTTMLTAALLLLPGIAQAQEGLREVSSKPPYRGIYGGINFSLAVPTGPTGRRAGGTTGRWDDGPMADSR